jgi:hypothetical protein
VVIPEIRSSGARMPTYSPWTNSRTDPETHVQIHTLMQRGVTTRSCTSR